MHIYSCGITQNSGTHLIIQMNTEQHFLCVFVAPEAKKKNQHFMGFSQNYTNSITHPEQ